MITTILFYSMLINAQMSDVISLDSAKEFYNKNYMSTKITTDTGYLKFTSFFDILKLSQDSLKVNIIKGIDIKKMKFAYENKFLSREQLITIILKTNNEFRSVYVFNCIDMLLTFKNYELLNVNTVDDFAKSFGVFDLESYKEFKKSNF